MKNRKIASLSSGMLATYCNPLPLPDLPVNSSYCMGKEWMRKVCAYPPHDLNLDWRDAGDGEVFSLNNTWYLRLLDGYGKVWQSDDFLNWTARSIVEPCPPRWATGPVQYGDWLYMGEWLDRSGKNGCAIWRAHPDHPLGPWERLGEKGADEYGGPTYIRDHKGNPICGGAPTLFKDDDGALYCYYDGNGPKGSHHLGAATYGVRLRDDDPSRHAEAPVQLLPQEPTFPWEHFGDHHQHFWANKEGVFMTKRNGRYYLQYTTCGCTYRTYAVGCYVGDRPLGPFVPQKHNPILVTRGGLLNGCGHNHIVEGPGGHLWCFYSVLVNGDRKYERRMAMDPAGIDENGELFIAGPTETPQWAPGVNPHPEKGNDAGLLPLTVNEPVTASSWREGREPIYAVDDYIRTWWEPSEKKCPHWLQVDLGGEFHVAAARVMFADRGLNYKKGVVPAPYRYRIEGSSDGRKWEVLCDQSQNKIERHIDYHTWTPRKAKHVRLVVLGIPRGMRLGVWEFTAFGKTSFAG